MSEWPGHLKPAPADLRPAPPGTPAADQPIDPDKRCTCGCPIVFVVNEQSGQKVPLDLVSPVYQVVTDAQGRRLCRKINAYVNHYRTCRHADEYARGRRR